MVGPCPCCGCDSCRLPDIALASVLVQFVHALFNVVVILIVLVAVRSLVLALVLVMLFVVGWVVSLLRVLHPFVSVLCQYSGTMFMHNAVVGSLRWGRRCPVNCFHTVQSVRPDAKDKRSVVISSDIQAYIRGSNRYLFTSVCLDPRMRPPIGNMVPQGFPKFKIWHPRTSQSFSNVRGPEKSLRLLRGPEKPLRLVGGLKKP